MRLDFLKTARTLFICTSARISASDIPKRAETSRSDFNGSGIKIPPDFQTHTGENDRGAERQADNEIISKTPRFGEEFRRSAVGQPAATRLPAMSRLEAKNRSRLGSRPIPANLSRPN
jgi:hypothetical protein